MNRLFLLQIFTDDSNLDQIIFFRFLLPFDDRINVSKKTSVLLDPEDNLPAMEVGRWVTETKHKILGRYVHISHAARKKYINSAYIDLFAGPGRVMVKGLNHFADGGPIAAWKIAKANDGCFTHFLVADASPDYLAALKLRLEKFGAPGSYFPGVAHDTIDEILKVIPSSGLHLALLDPFNAGHLHFSIIKKLATLKRVDIAVHLSTGDIQRNISKGLKDGFSTLDNFAPGWQQHVNKYTSKQEMRKQFIDYWKELVCSTGMKVCDTMYPVKNSKESRMYHLCLLSYHPLANNFWTKACNIDATKDLFD